MTIKLHLTKTNFRVVANEQVLVTLQSSWYDSEEKYLSACTDKIHAYRTEYNADIEYESDPHWCLCPGDGLPDSYYVPDGQNPDCSKHHYRCNQCHSITQIG